ncbi:periplasmic binding protein-like I [Polychytrium aggregatum]|uniref:periplasmic binding protein-like I n=1 Tax=Polychytrium aggregatum TaxID=110093 RepID=UPI0022FE4CBF|nr:periplasmic binding protein-like I [Polychytrium aggregatum]KAI9201874.1 periplasmic binding protein-like I [Polychytrium aggregatum]
MIRALLVAALGLQLAAAVFNRPNPYYQSYPPAYPLDPAKNQSTRVLTIGVFGWFTSPVLPDDFGTWAAGVEDAVQLYLSVQAAADEFNANNTLLPGIKVAVDAIDIYDVSDIGMTANSTPTHLPLAAHVQFIKAENAIFMNKYAGFIGTVETLVAPQTACIGTAPEQLLVVHVGGEEKSRREGGGRGTHLSGSRGIADWVASMGWTKVVLLITCSQNDFYGGLFVNGFIQRAPFLGITILDTIYFYCGTSMALSDNDFVTPVNRMLATYGRIFVVFGRIDVVSALYLQVGAVECGIKAGLNQEQYIWFTSSARFYVSDYEQFFQDPSNQAASYYLGRNVTESDLNGEGPVSYWPTNPTWIRFNTTWSTYGQRSLTYPVNHQHVAMPMIYDCTLAMLYGYDRMLRDYPTQVTLDKILNRELDPSFLTPANFSVPQPGSCGPLQFDELGDSTSGGLHIYLMTNNLTMVFQTALIQSTYNYTLNVRYENNYTINDIFHIYANDMAFPVPVDFPPLNQINPGYKDAVAFLCIGAFLCGLVVLVLVFSVIFNERINPTTAMFLRLNLLAAIIGYVTLLFHIGTPSSTSCLAKSYCVATAYAISIGAHLVRSFELRILAPCRAKGKLRESISPKYMALTAAAIVVLGWIMCGASYIQSPAVVSNLVISGITVYVACVPSQVSLEAFAAFFGILALLLLLTLRNLEYSARFAEFRTQAVMLVLSAGHLIALSAIAIGLDSMASLLRYTYLIGILSCLLIPTAVAIPIILAVAFEVKKSTMEESKAFAESWNIPTSKSGFVEGFLIKRYYPVAMRLPGISEYRSCTLWIVQNHLVLVPVTEKTSKRSATTIPEAYSFYPISRCLAEIKGENEVRLGFQQQESVLLRLYDQEILEEFMQATNHGLSACHHQAAHDGDRAQPPSVPLLARQHPGPMLARQARQPVRGTTMAPQSKAGKRTHMTTKDSKGGHDRGAGGDVVLGRRGPVRLDLVWQWWQDEMVASPTEKDLWPG